MNQDISFFSGSSKVAKMGIDQLIIFVLIVLVIIVIVLLVKYLTDIDKKVSYLNKLYSEIDDTIQSAINSINSCLETIDREYDTSTEKIECKIQSESLLRQRISDIHSIASADNDSTKIVLDKEANDAVVSLNKADKLIKEFTEMGEELFLSDRSPFKTAALSISQNKTLDIYNKYKELKSI